jgi:hypothetical protein
VKTFLIVSGVAFWLLVVPSVVIVATAVIRGIRAIRAARRLDPITLEAANGIGQVEDFLSGGSK